MADIERETMVSAGMIDAAGLLVVPYGPVLGAEVAGLRIGGSIDADAFAALRALLLRHKVLFFRDVWDNRATQRYPVADYWPACRRMERVTIRRDVPFDPVAIGPVVNE